MSNESIGGTRRTTRAHYSTRFIVDICSVIASSSMAGTISTSIFFPALPSLEFDLGASPQQVSIAISLFILIQGVTPMLWASFSEIRGRKAPYIVSVVIYCLATIGCAKVTDVNAFIGLRCLQSFGTSAVLALGAGTLADIYDVHERGTKLGIYYISPALGCDIFVLACRVLITNEGYR